MRARAGMTAARTAAVALVATLAIQIYVSVAATATAVLAPEIAREFGVPARWIGVFVGLVYTGGMFASLDGGSFRRVRAFVHASGRTQEVDPDPSFAEIVGRAALFPSDRLTYRLARDIARDERDYGNPVDSVRIEVWRVEFAPRTLAPAYRLLRERTVVVPPGP